jgi:hypothetical protein
MKFARYTCLLALGAAAGLAQTTTAIAITRTTGMVGIANAQTGRLNLLNPGTTWSGASLVCTAAVSFFDGDGNHLKSTTLSIPPGQSMLFDLHSDADLNLAVGARLEIRAVITQPGVPGATPTSAPTQACPLVPTLEIFDTISGRTLVTLGHAHVVP